MAINRNRPNCGVGEIEKLENIGPSREVLENNERIDRKHAKFLYENLKAIGLARGETETEIQYSRRCREYYKTRLLGASSRIGKSMV